MSTAKTEEKDARERINKWKKHLFQRKVNPPFFLHSIIPLNSNIPLK